MKKFIIIMLAFFGSISIAEGRALLNALRSPEAEILAGENGVYIIFAQTNDETTVKNVEALDTLYFLADQSIPAVAQMLIFKTDKRINLLRYKMVDTTWGDTVLFNPAELPIIDLQRIQRKINKASGDKSIASIRVSYFLGPTRPLIVSFLVKNNGDELCEQYRYNVDIDEIINIEENQFCFFDMDA